MNDVFISNNGQLRVKSNLLCRRSFEASIPRMLRAAVRKIQAAQPGQARLHERGRSVDPDAGRVVMLLYSRRLDADIYCEDVTCSSA